MIILAFDTETTGIPEWKLPSDDPKQPHLVSLAFVVRDTETNQTLNEQHWIVRPDGWTIPDEVAAIHGITTEYAEEQGVPLEDVLTIFATMCGASDQRVAYGAPFDNRILRIALLRIGWSKEEIEGFFALRPVQCAMTAATPLCRMAPTDKMMATGRRTGFKSPKLAEAYEILCGKTLEGAHSALADTHAALDVWLEIQARTTNPETF
jgi:DNA polymerase-3 subunit epsilon